MNLTTLTALVDSYTSNPAIEAMGLPAGYGVVRLDLVRGLLGALREARGLLAEGRELSMSNQRAASMRHRLGAWGDRVEAFLETIESSPVGVRTPADTPDHTEEK